MKYLLRLLVWCLPWSVFAAYAETGNVYVIVNNAYKGRVALSFPQPHFPCMTEALLREWGVRSESVATMLFTNNCVSPKSLELREIKFFFDDRASLLTLVIPEPLFTNRENGVTTSRWDDGINAAFVDYHLTYSHTTGDNYRGDDRQHSLYVSLNEGVNLGPWRLRYNPVYQKETWGNPQWHTERAVAFRTLRTLRSSLTLGDNSTASTLFDSVSYRGINVQSDDRMLPDDYRPFSPWIRGFARSNAQVKIRQNGTVIYQTFVSPGTFILKDVYPPNPDGDIEMTIKESDGTETVRTLPWSSMPNLVHSQHWAYDLTAGKYRPYVGVEAEQPLFYQFSAGYGLPAEVSLYGGMQNSDIYHSAAAGIGKNLNNWGALSLDYSYATAQDPRRNKTVRGGMARLRYAKAFQEWESSLSLLVQYYPDQHYRTFGETISQQTSYWWDWEEGKFVGEFEAEKKTRLELRYNQYLSESDSFYLTLARETYRGKNREESSLELGYSGSWQDVDYSVYAQYSHPNYGKEQGEIVLSFSVPLDWLALPRLTLNIDHTTAKNGDNIRQVGVSGTALDDYSLSYSLSNTQQQNKKSSQNASADYQYNAGELRLGYSQGDGFRQQDAEISGSIMAYRHGIVLGQSLGDTLGIINVPGASGIGVDNQYGTTTDWRGQAIISNLTPYRVNRLSLSSWDLPDGMTLPESEIEVVPTAGAIMYSKFAPPVYDKVSEP